ncbi:helix-turn-helix transcriptional regulator [Brevibacterium sediminis]
MPYDLKSTPSGIPMQTVTTAARLTGLSEKTIRRRIADGTLPAYRIGLRAIRISDDDLLSLYEPVNQSPTDSQKRITQLAEARERQNSYKALRAVQIAEDDSNPGGEHPNAADSHGDPTANAAIHRVDGPPVVRVGPTGVQIAMDKAKREAGPFGVTDGVKELTYHNGRECEAWKAVARLG